MSKDKLTDYSATNSLNTDVGGVNIDEGMLPSDVNNALREVMTHLKDFAEGTQAVNNIRFAGATTTGDINFGDNDKAVFGAGSDLQIYHDGSNSWLRDTGTGNLYIQGSSAVYIRGENSEFLASFGENSATTLYHNGNSKLATTATGVDITGTLTADDNIVLDGASSPAITITDTTNSATSVLKAGNVQGIVGTTSNHDFFVRSNDTNRIGVAAAGDVSLYASDGTTQGFFWDASADSLGLGTTSPLSSVSSSQAGLHIAHSNVAYISLDNTNTNGHKYTIFSDDNGKLHTYDVDAGSFRMVLDGSGNVGIGTTSPSSFTTYNDSKLVVGTGTGPNGITIYTGNTSQGGIFFADGTSGASTYAGILRYNHSDNAMLFFTNGLNERMRIDSSGNLLVGNTSNTTSQAGVYLNSNGRFFATHSGSSSIFNRLSTDGDILLFQKDTSTVGSISVTGSGTTYNTTSDLRLKENIEPLVATDKLMAMNPVSYNWKADPDGPRSMGFIAQEMQEVMPEAVSTGDDEDAMMSMDYGRITPILVSALQDAHRKIEELEQRIADMEAK
jgi:hypothetical protein